MDEGVFLVFAIVGAIITAIALFFIRHYEDEIGRTKNRLSTVTWFFFVATIGLGFVNISDSLILASIVGVVSLYFGIRSWKMRGMVTKKHQKLWVAISLVPFSGWLFQHLQFPYLHSSEAEAARFNADTIDDF